MIRVMHVITDMQFGGAGRWLINLVSAMDYHEFEVSVVIPTGSVLKKKLEAYPITVLEADGLENISYSREGVKNLKRLIRQQKVDIVHTHACLSAKIAARFLRRKIVFTKHCMESKPEMGLKLKAKQMLNGYFTDEVIAVSEAVAKSMEPVFPPNFPMHVVYSGVAPFHEISEEEKLALRASYGIGPEEIVLGIVARLARVKAHEFFIEAADIVAGHLSGVKFLIVGDGPRMEELKALAAEKPSLKDRLIFTGYIENVEPIMNIIDINVITSLHEALCLSVIEGLSLGIPAIVTRTGGLVEVIEYNETGILVPVANAIQLAAAMDELIGDKERRIAMRENCIQKAAEKFSLETMAKKTQEIYKNLL